VATFDPEDSILSAPGPQSALVESCTPAAPQRRAPFGEGRLWLSLRTVLVALQVAWLSLVGWIGGFVTLLPIAIDGAPLGRRVRPTAPRVMRLLEPPREALPR
jgi:hypothetical protein